MDKEDVVHVYNGTLLSHRKNDFKSVIVRWMNLGPTIQSEVKEKNKYHILSHMTDLHCCTEEINTIL